MNKLSLSLLKLNFSHEEQEQIREKLYRRLQPEPNIDLVESVVAMGKRWYAVWSTLYPYRVDGTFHDFLLQFLIATLTPTWLADQRQASSHIIGVWFDAFDKWRLETSISENRVPDDKRPHPDMPTGIYSIVPSGEVKALTQLAYDVFCLQAINKLPEFLLDRIKDRHEFQGARYELAVAAIITRAGFDITFLDIAQQGTKHCEFIARHKKTGIEIGVEAKSRRRPGILHEHGTFDENKSVMDGITALFNKALDQKPNNLPFLVFIDLNIPVRSSLAPAILDKMLTYNNRLSATDPDEFNAFILTNFSYYYFGEAPVAADRNNGCRITQSQNPKHPINNPTVLPAIWNSLGRYSYIPPHV